MATKTIKTRVMNKYDTEANWSKATFTPLKGELIIYAPDEAHQYERFKVGDGITAIGELPFSVDSAISIAVENFNDIIAQKSQVQIITWEADD